MILRKCLSIRFNGGRSVILVHPEVTINKNPRARVFTPLNSQLSPIQQFLVQLLWPQTFSASVFEVRR